MTLTVHSRHLCGHRISLQTVQLIYWGRFVDFRWCSSEHLNGRYRSNREGSILEHLLVLLGERSRRSGASTRGRRQPERIWLCSHGFSSGGQTPISERFHLPEEVQDCNTPFGIIAWSRPTSCKLVPAFSSASYAASRFPYSRRPPGTLGSPRREPKSLPCHL